MDESTQSRQERLRYLSHPSESTPEEKQHKQQELDAAFEEIQKDSPGILLGNEILADYKLAQSETEKKESCRRVIRNFFGHPYTLETFFDRLNFLAEFDETNTSFVNVIRSDIEKMLEETIFKENLGIKPNRSEIMTRWMELYTYSELYKPLVEKILRLSFDSDKTEKAHFEHATALAQVVVTQNDMETVASALRILLRDTPILRGDEADLNRYAIGLLHMDDTILKASLDIDSVIDFFGQQYEPKSHQVFREKIDTVFHKNAETSRFGEYITRNMNNPKLQAIVNFHDAINADTNHLYLDSADFSDKKIDVTQYPYNLILDPEHISPLRRAFNIKFAEHLGDSFINVYSPSIGEAVLPIPSDTEELITQVKAWFYPEKVKDARITNADIFKTIGLLFKELPTDEKTKLMERVFLLKGNLRTRLLSLVSPRGDQIIIEDGFLNSIGIGHITFIPGKSIFDLEVSIRIGKFDCVCKLDSYYTLRDIQNRPLPISPEKSLILSELILSHLAKLLCEKPEKQKMTNLEKGEPHPSRETVRRAHIRKLPPGQSYTPQQAELALCDYGIDLARFNSDLGFSKENGQYTLVSQVTQNTEQASPTLTPVVTHMKGASLAKDFFDTK